MDELERLDNLRARQQELFNNWNVVKQNVTNRLYELLNNYNQGNVPLYWSDDYKAGIEGKSWRDDGTEWVVYKTIEFQDPDGKRDFGSSFDLRISNLRITVNMGSIGSWGSDDKCQLSRINLVQSIFLHEQELIDEMSKVVDMSEVEERYKVSREIDQINSDLEKAKVMREELVFRVKLKPGMYLANLGKRWEYPKNEDGSTNWDVIPKEVRYYTAFEKIVKVTEVSVMTTEHRYNWINHRHRIKDVINQLRWKHWYLIDDLNAIPPEEEDSK